MDVLRWYKNGLHKYWVSDVTNDANFQGPLPVALASGGGAITLADGADVTQGAKADAAWQGGASGSEVAILKAIAAIFAPRGHSRGLLTTGSSVVPVLSGSKAALVYCSTLTRVGAGSSSSAAASVQQKQTITGGDATSGNFTLTFQGQTSGNIAYNASAANVVTALVAMSSIGAAGVAATGGALNAAPVIVTFASGILDGTQPLLVPTTVDLAGGVSAGSRLPVVTESTAASNIAAYCEAGSVLEFRISSTDAYLYLTAESGTGSYRIGWFS